MIRPAPPAPFKTALLAFLVAVIVALGVARGASARDANWESSVIDSSCTALVHR